jgi:dihydropyrimidine dehydrogenase (NAD+) subunit PreA
MTSTPRLLPLLPTDRLEHALPDAKPLYTADQALAEANRCLYCYDAPCIKACPTGIDIPTFIKKIATGNIVGSAKTILSSNVLGYSCARVCPVEVLCAGDCVYNEWEREPIQIGKLQRYATEHALQLEADGKAKLLTAKPRGAHTKKIALLGGGPASLACAAELALEGHAATLFEKRPVPGGLNTTGVAPYKLHAHDALKETEWVLALGVELVSGVEVGADLPIDKLLADYDAVFIGVGLGADSKLGVDGEAGAGVIGATAFIERMKTEGGYSLEGVNNALVIGGGNTAIDCARELAELGVPDVAMVYRRPRSSMSGYAHELEGARIAGARVIESTVGRAVVRNTAGDLTGLSVVTMKNDKAVDGSEHVLPADLIVLAIGQSKLGAIVDGIPGAALDAKGRVIVDATTRRTGNPKVYAGGDCINGGKEVVNAVADGRDAARAMIRAFSSTLSVKPLPGHSRKSGRRMADLSVDMCGIKSPNPFWLASAPPTNGGEQIMRAFDAGWGGAVWKTLGNPVVNVSSRFGGLDYNGKKIIGFNNIELITDRPLETNLKEIYEVKKRYPKHAVIASLMVETKEEWKEIIKKAEDAGADGLELNFGCPHGMCERGMGSSVGQEPKVLQEITSWVKEYAKTPVLVKLTPNIGDILEPGFAAKAGGADGLALINTIKSIIGVNLDNLQLFPNVGGESTNGGYCGPAVKPIALHMVAALAREEGIRIPISGIGGIETWRDAAEFIALGSTTVQVCTAVMHYGYRIVEDMIEGLSSYLDSRGMKSVNELVGAAIPGYKEWGELDLGYDIVARIDPEKCIGCQLCYTACLDGAHQCIHTEAGPCHAWHGAPDHGKNPRLEPNPAQRHLPQAGSPVRVPIVDEKECIGCNLCALVCPVEGCITMTEVARKTPERDTWNDRMAAGFRTPGGLDSSKLVRPVAGPRRRPTRMQHRTSPQSIGREVCLFCRPTLATERKQASFLNSVPPGSTTCAGWGSAPGHAVRTAHVASSAR